MILPFPPIAAEVALAATLLLNSIIVPETTQTMHYEFGNGSVQIDYPMEFPGVTLVEPKFLGAGGGGSVWTMKANANTNINNDRRINNIHKNVVVKISWPRSTDSVRNECDILRAMERQGVTGVERCLGSMDYKYDPNRVVIAMEPLVEDDDTSSLGDLTPEIALRSAIQLGKIMAQMIAANVVTTDIQPLISKSTGEVLLIDMTEAKLLNPDRFIAEGDKLLINAFCTEVLGLIPDSLLDKTSESFLKELHRIETETGERINGEIKEILRDLPITGVEKLL
uniref:Protein kinase domain-containing protein n=1 Tax=Pseudo-nitzschia australis TaxID=44445 RepID=A0A7S4EHD1_9STRA|mmetsp:Transcript_19169/g.41645  ORF Transcript_19169/g.41645 Transcript_19169/m.41645 type:complete len:282 (-) Transcript_19169:425-1270(-)